MRYMVIVKSVGTSGGKLAPAFAEQQTVSA